MFIKSLHYKLGVWGLIGADFGETRKMKYFIGLNYVLCRKQGFRGLTSYYGLEVWICHSPLNFV